MTRSGNRASTAATDVVSDSGSAAPQFAGGYGSVPAGAIGAFATQTTEAPIIWGSQDSSYSLLYGNDSRDGLTSQEGAGWIVYPSAYGDRWPHLVVDYTDGNANQPCIPRCAGWVPQDTTVQPGAQLPVDGVQHSYDIRQQDGNWWFGYDGRWMGYLPGRLWPRFFNKYFTTLRAGGEVSLTGSDCNQMGNGHNGSDPLAARYGTVQWGDGVNWSLASLFQVDTDPLHFNSGYWWPGPDRGSGFSYGGQGC